ncbi:MAG: PP2C family protein-serine/threonine phosphatase, partial [Candidatus Ventricola sp.]
MSNALTLDIFGQQILGKRENQEDSFAWTPNHVQDKRGVLCIVSDGMGGMARGEEYSQSAIAEAKAAFAQSSPDQPPHKVLLDCYARIHKAALALRKSPEDSDGGATLVMVLLRDGQCSFLSVGDSRIYLMRSGGLIQLNREQTLGAMLDERAALGIISEVVASTNRYRASLTNHTNMDTPLPCDMNSVPFPLIAGDKLALMSDGVFGTLSDAELTRLLSQRGSTAVGSVLQAVERKQRRDQDNSTLVLVEVHAPSD